MTSTDIAVVVARLEAQDRRADERHEGLIDALTGLRTDVSATQAVVADLRTRVAVTEAVQSALKGQARETATVLRDKAHDVADDLKETALTARTNLTLRQQMVSLRWTIAAMFITALLGSTGAATLTYLLRS